jgi:hypothetical protein
MVNKIITTNELPHPSYPLKRISWSAILIGAYRAMHCEENQ